ncbi:DUF4178 domain-containing protein [Corynebacterium halotolerans]|uniref:DUF4178 domain-containing protein n=1 Tax=Corynebacterium halotolerans TaxID=225326 RepID=UPI003CEB40EA
MSSSVWLVLAVILVIVAVVFLIISVRKRDEDGIGEQPSTRRDMFQESDGSANFSPSKLGPGAIISYGGIDYVIRGAIRLRQGQYTWHEYLLEGGKGAEWLSVEYDEGQLNLGWWLSRKDLDLEPAQELTVEGTRYRKVESGVGEYTTEGTTGLGERGRYKYWDMAETGGNRLLGLEVYGEDGPTEASLGWKILPGEITVYPAPGN